MNVQKELELLSGVFGLCTKIWDKDKNEYVDATETDIVDCCLKSAQPFIQLCNKTCNELETEDLKNPCRQTCNDIISSTELNCLLSGENWGLDNNPVLKAFKYYGCGDARYKDIDLYCINKHKNEIISRCVNDCSHSNNKDCNKLCQYSYNFFSNPQDRVLKPNKVTKRVAISKNSVKPVNIWNYIFSATGFIILIVIIYFLIKKYTVKNK